ncbi:MAG TPA: hypothetical protein VK284_04075 [Streptosporangiaceae bacterium]|nr:hypothetical protein [Streptosporangiaceae bacterium]
MNTKSLLTKAVLTAGAVGVLAGAGATAASAATTPPVRGEITAVTHISHRYDGGGAGNWAVDKFSRTLQIQYLGKSTDPAYAKTPYMYTATISDTGTFVNLPGQLAPNQGGSHHGQVMKPNQVSGTMTGSGQFGLFYASAKDARGLVPRALNSFALNANPAYGSPVWPELAFPAGTVFSGVNEAGFGYYYNVPALTVTHVTYKWVHGKKVAVKHVQALKAQNWADTAWNDAGQAPRDGQILGR